MRTTRERAIAGAALALLVMASPTATGAQTGEPAPALPDWYPGTPERIAIRAQIEALSTEYYYRLDHGEGQSVAELFTPEGVFRPGGSGPFVGREAIRDYYARRSKTWVTRHVSTNLRLVYVDADHVEAVRTFTYYMGDRAKSAGPYPAIPSVSEYRESVVRGADGVWRYALRVATGLFSAR
jgi:hypothetical protein